MTTDPRPPSKSLGPSSGHVPEGPERAGEGGLQGAAEVHVGHDPLGGGGGRGVSRPGRTVGSLAHGCSAAGRHARELASAIGARRDDYMRRGMSDYLCACEGRVNHHPPKRVPWTNGLSPRHAGGCVACATVRCTFWHRWQWYTTTWCEDDVTVARRQRTTHSRGSTLHTLGAWESRANAGADSQQYGATNCCWADARGVTWARLTHVVSTIHKNTGFCDVSLRILKWEAPYLNQRYYTYARTQKCK